MRRHIDMRTLLKQAGEHLKASQFGQAADFVEGIVRVIDAMGRKDTDENATLAFFGHFR